MAQQPLLIVRAWQEKSLEVSTRSKDRLIAAVSKGFDAMAAFLDKDADPADVQCALGFLNVERSIAYKFDKSKDDSLRDLMYGVLESLHVSLNEWNEERNQVKETGEFSTQTEEEVIQSLLEPLIYFNKPTFPMGNHRSNNLSTVTTNYPTPPIEAKEEPIDIHQSLLPNYQISDSELMRDENLFKEEEMDSENNELIAANSDPILSDSRNILEQALNTIRSLPFKSIEDPTDFSQILPRDRTTSLNSLRDEMDFKEEEASNDYVNSGMEDAVGDSHKEPPFNNDGYAHRTIQPSDVMDYQMDFDHEACSLQLRNIHPSGDPGLQENNSLNEISMRIEDVVETAQAEIDGEERGLVGDLASDLIDNEGEEEEDIDHPTDTSKDTPESVKVDKRRRSSRNVSKLVLYNESMEDSDGNDGPSTKKSRSDYMEKDDKERRSFKGDDRDDVTKRVRVSKKNGTELECPECEFRSLSVPAWDQHLRKRHSTTPALAGLALLCECGYEGLSDDHSRTCAGNSTVIRKSDGPQCVQCEIHPKTANGYCLHLRRHHNSTLAQAYCCDRNIGVSKSFQNGIYLKCSCGLEVRSQNNYKHLNDCNPRQFTLHKLDDS